MAREDINGISVPIPDTGEPPDFVSDLRRIATDVPASTYLLKRSTSINAHDPAWSIDEMIGDGVSITSELQAILDESVADITKARTVELGRLAGLLGSTLFIPYGARMLGAGIGGALPNVTNRGTVLIRQAGFNGDLIRFREANLQDGRANIGPLTLADFALYSEAGCTGGRGIAFKTEDGTLGIIQDTTTLARLFIRRQPEGGILCPAGARPLHAEDIKTLWNGGPGVEFVADQGDGSTLLTSSIDFDAFSGDGNIGGLLKISGGSRHAAFLILSAKSERRVNTHFAAPGVEVDGSNPAVAQQDDAIWLDNVASEVIVKGATHISSVPNTAVGGGISEPPGAMFKITGAAIPRLRWEGCTIRVRDASDSGAGPDVVNIVEPAMVRDEERGVTVPYTETTGTYGYPKESGDTYAKALPAGQRRASLPRTSPMVATSPALQSGRMQMVAVWYDAGDVVTSITFHSGTTAATSPTNQWFGLWGPDLEQLGLTADDGSTAWAASAAKTLDLTAPVVIPESGWYYHSVVVVASGMPTVVVASSAAGVTGLSPVLTGASNTGLTNPASAPVTADAITPSGSILYTTSA